MSEKFLEYLRREHARLTGELVDALDQRFIDRERVARLEKLKEAIEAQIEDEIHAPELAAAA